MELVKKNIHRNGTKVRATTQITLDEDVNILDTKEDVGRIVQEKACLHIEEIKSEENQAIIRGAVLLDVLYTTGDGEGTLCEMGTKIPIEETLQMEGISMLDRVNGRGELEEVSVGLINSRKINVKGIISLTASVDEMRDEEVIVGIVDEQKTIQTLEKKLNILQLCMHKKDHCRIKDEIVLASTKPNIHQMLWNQIQPVNVEMKCLQGQLSVHGELKILILYTAEEENYPVQVVEELLPFHSTVECSGCREDMISQIQWEMGQIKIDVKPDYDGEERVFAIEGVMELEICLFEEESISLLADTYSTASQMEPLFEEMEYQTLLVKNQSKSRVNGTVAIGKNQPRILQAYQASGTVKADEIQKTDEGLLVEGVVCVQLLYVTSDDEMPYASVRGQIPFQQIVEVPNMEEDADYMIQADLEQVQATMSDSEEVECKCSINLNVLIFGRRKEQVIKDVEEKELDYRRLNEIPGMIGYIASEGDTLWKIAKEYSTTVDILRQMNEFKGSEVKSGDKFLILKSVAG